MKRNDAIKELQETEWLRALNTEQRYTVPPEKMCDIHPENIPRYTAEYAACTAKERPNPVSDGVLLYMTDGGANLTNTKFYSWEVLPFFESILNLFDGLLFLHANDVIHMDIKTDNIVALKNPDTTITTRIIDFGISIPLKSYFAKALDYTNGKNARYPELAETNYYIWPAYSKFASGIIYTRTDIPGIIQLLNGIRNYINNPAEAYLATTIDEVYTYGPPPPGWTFPSPFSVAPYRALWSDPAIASWLTTFLSKSLAEKKATELTPDIPIYPYIKKILCGIDVFALGLLIYHMYKRLVVISSDPFNPAGYKLRAGMPIPSDRAFVLRILNEITKPLEALVLGMMANDYNTYTPLEEARNIYRDTILPKMRELLNVNLADPANKFMALFTQIHRPRQQAGGKRRTRSAKHRKVRKTRRNRSVR